MAVNMMSLDYLLMPLYYYNWADGAYMFWIADSYRLSAIWSVEVDVPHDPLTIFVLCFSLIITYVIMKITSNKSFKSKNTECIS